MITIFNFSHPLSKKANDQLAEQFVTYQVVNITVQLDLSAPVREQVWQICRKSVQVYQPDYIILPGLAIAAVYIDRYFSKPEDDYPPVVTYKPLIRLVQEPGTSPPVFVVAEIEK